MYSTGKIKDFEDGKLIEERRNRRKSQYVSSNSDVDNYKHEIVKEIATKIPKQTLNDSDKKIIAKIHLLLEEFGNRNVSIHCEKEIINFRRKWIGYKGKEKTRYETGDMIENKEELYTDLKELNAKMGAEIKRIDNLDGKLKAFVIFD